MSARAPRRATGAAGGRTTSEAPRICSPPTSVLASAADDRRPAASTSLESNCGATPPSAGNRIAPLHFMTQDGGDFAALDRHDWGTADDYMVLATQGTTHVDGLAHVWSGGSLYNGFPFTEVRSSGTARLGLEKLGGLVAAAHLLDFTHLRGDDAPEITADARRRGVRRAGPATSARRRRALPDRLDGGGAEIGAGTRARFLSSLPSMGEWFADHDIAIVGRRQHRRGGDGPAWRPAAAPQGSRPRPRRHHDGAAEPASCQARTESRVASSSSRHSGYPEGVGSPVNPLLIA